jgi:hypothetical protein
MVRTYQRLAIYIAFDLSISSLANPLATGCRVSTTNLSSLGCCAAFVEIHGVDRYRHIEH